MASQIFTSLPQNVLKRLSAIALRHTSSYSGGDIPEDVMRLREQNRPVDMPSPYERPRVQCILCRHGLEPDYKNVRLLSQFVSPYTGRIYGRHITALCERKQLRVEREIGKAQRAGLMATYLKNPVFFNDPKLYDPENPLRPHKH